ncbi:hypothetical protein [Granulicella tundricola]|uniref:Uncharacterized protein n=1 Tax=Granulicella tundricola (strain ATCC BAA-1859 / DSM 23138 / MP5ACTX9) TaxID=1198114 RepID=E8X7F1_GRATM|nr:hypothetical protein [Granulicella tundricola]ADW71385.1 hypothetical protein AciX9_4439 [Granulicella tundricola MP5ACTX9]
MTITNTFKDLAGGGLDVFTPKASSSQEDAPSAKQLEKVAKDAGFALDNLPVTRRVLKSGRVASKERAQPMTLRIRVNDWNRFSSFCERNDYTVAEGFERLASLADEL